jgi:hypothetical protein
MSKNLQRQYLTPLFFTHFDLGTFYRRATQDARERIPTAPTPRPQKGLETKQPRTIYFVSYSRNYEEY